MNYNSSALEYSAIGLGLLSLILNILLLIILRKLRNTTEVPELKLIYTIIFVDLMILLTCIVQEGLALLYTNPMKNTLGCQILGILHTLLPIGSLSGVTVLSLERFAILYRLCYLKRHIVITFSIIISLLLSLSILCAALNQFSYAPSMMMCMVTPNFGWSGSIFYYAIIAMLSICWCCILFSYTMIIRLRHCLDGSKARTDELDHTHGCEYGYEQAPTSVTNSVEPLSCDYSSESRHNNSKNFLIHNNTRSQISIKTRSFSISKTVIKSLIIMLIYTICLLPCIIILIYHSIQTTVSISYSLPSILSGLFFAFLFSFAVINPILMLCLHGRITEGLLSLFY